MTRNVNLSEAAPRSRRDGHGDLVFDFSGMDSPDLGGLCLMLTARVLAGEDNRRVWLHALPDPAWRLLHAMGLERYFELLPASGKLVN